MDQVKPEASTGASLGSTTLFVPSVKSDTGRQNTVGGNLALNSSIFPSASSINLNDPAGRWGINLAYHDPNEAFPHEYMSGMVQHNAAPQVDINNVIKTLEAKRGQGIDIDKLLAAAPPAQREQIIEAWNKSLTAQPVTSEEDDDAENPNDNLVRLLMLGGAGIVGTNSIIKQARRFPSARAIRRGLDAAKKKAEEARRNADKTKIEATDATKAAERAEHVAETARAGEQGLIKANGTKEELAHVVQTGRAMEKGFQATDNAAVDSKELTAARIKAEKDAEELKKASERAAQLTKEAEKKSQTAQIALKDAEKQSRIAETIRRDFGGIRRLMHIATAAVPSMALSLGTSFLVWRTVKGLAVFALELPDKSPAEAFQDGLGSATKSPFSQKANEEIEKHQYAQAGMTITTDVIREAKEDFNGGLKWLKEHPPEVLEADAKQIATEMERLNTLYKQNPEEAKAVALGLFGIIMPHSLDEGRTMMLAGVKGQDSGLAERTGQAIFADDKLLSNGLDLYMKNLELKAQEPARPVVAAASKPEARHES